MAKTLAEVLRENDPYRLTQDEGVPTFSRDLRKGCTRFVSVAAQNVTKVHPEFLACLKTYCDARRAELLVHPLLYKNPTSEYHGARNNARWWDTAVRDYLWNVRLPLNANLLLLADVRTQPTAVAPLTGFDAVSLASSAILPHTKLQLRSVATPQGKMAKTLTTTGAATQEHYTQTKAGKIGEFHHSLSAVVVELDGGKFYMRQLHYSKSARRIIDLDTAYHPNGAVRRAPRALAIVGGDTHVDFVDPQVMEGVDALASLVDPEWFVEHDLLDGYSCNPHHKGSYMQLIAKMLAAGDRSSIAAEVERVKGYLQWRRAKFPRTKVAVIRSNHNDFLGRAVQAFIAGGMGALPHISPTNASFLAKLAARQLDAMKLTEIGTEYPEAFGLLLDDMKIPGVEARGGRDDIFMVGDIGCGLHGHEGPNGARGSVRNMARSGVKLATGHGHAHEIFEGHTRAGTRTRRKAEYTGPLGAWMNTDILINADSKRQLITYIDGRFTR